MPEDPTAEQRILIQEVYEVFRVDGSWPVHQYLDKRLDQAHGLAIEDVLSDMPEGLLRVDEPRRPERPVELRVAGLVYCESAEDDMALFLRVLQWCVGRESAFRPASPTASEELRLTSAEARADWNDGLEVDEVMLAKAYAFLGTEWMHASMGGSPTEWTITVPREIRRFRRVRNVYDYIEIACEEERSRPTAANPMVGPLVPTVVVEPSQQVQVVGGGHTAGALLSLSFDSLHPLVRDASRELFAGNHYRQGVFDATLALLELVREKSGLTEPNDYALVGKALSPDNPRIRVGDLSTETGRNIQRGTHHLAQAIVARVRNPLAHKGVALDVVEAMEMVALISRVARDVDAGRSSADDGEM